MLRSLLIGAASGMRSLTPIAMVSLAARRGDLPQPGGAARLLAHPVVAGGLALLAAGEIAGDKMKSAPDRIIAPGIAARIATAGVAGAALAPRGRRRIGGALAVAAAVGSSYLTFAARKRSMRRYGQTSTGFVEDAVTLASAALIARGARAA